MNIMRKLKLLAICALFLSIATNAWAGGPAQTENSPVQSAKLVHTIAPSHGFVDDPFSFDRAGSRLLYVQADAGVSAHIVVVDVAQRTELFRVSLEKFSLRPSRVEFAVDGEHFLVWSQDEKSGKQRVALLAANGRVARKFGPADDIVRTQYQGQQALVVHEISSLKKRRKHREGDPVVRHTVGVYAVATGKLLGKKTKLDLDGTNRSKKLDFAFKYWAQNFTVAVGIKGGVWDRKENQRSPDFEGWYTMPTATFSKRLPITNLVAHRERLAKLIKHARRSRDIVVRRNLTGIDFVDNGNFKALKLAEPFRHYDPKSLVTQVSSTGNLFFTLTIDPVHPDAAAKRRAVKPWMDLYEYSPATNKVIRRARLLPPKVRKYSWRATKSHWAIIPRHIGFDRGGTKLLLYALE